MEGVEPDCGALAEAVVFLRYFKDLPGDRQARKVRYPLDVILLFCLSFVVSEAETFVDIALCGATKLKLLRKFRPFEHARRRTTTWVTSWPGLIRRRFNAALPPGWRPWPEHLKVLLPLMERPSVAGTPGKKDGKAAIHMVSALATRQRLVLGQIEVAEKSNEITAIPKVLDLLSLEGAVFVAVHTPYHVATA